ncbi:RNA deprotection pyrophosphohydrolase [Shouchella hunanensis]|uniref:Nucleoside triphosphatase YtkD n=1 Tax=Shouchella hunanensis TaxID=766894 RepID=A0ABY7W9H1_9BACI|nr:nucleoside triphosphatase YtkD [Shouchella hunanensis]WDF04289.1 nucleoside triphosphatase YtkD [Shouchella hunanensis]GAF21195.1 8-oxo-dGTPase [Bacillus sp. JCM 19047]
MRTFQDKNGYTVNLVLGDESPFTSSPKHVLIIARHQGSWVLTDHKARGYEFPGGKVEMNEELEAAVKRELWEETGGYAQWISYIGQYEVQDPQEVFYKSIYAVQIKRFDETPSGFETNGRKLIEELPIGMKADNRFSPIMQDDVVPQAVQYAISTGLFN